jgi:hypothetical protein
VRVSSSVGKGKERRPQIGETETEAGVKSECWELKRVEEWPAGQTRRREGRGQASGGREECDMGRGRAPETTPNLGAISELASGTKATLRNRGGTRVASRGRRQTPHSVARERAATRGESRDQPGPSAPCRGPGPSRRFFPEAALAKATQACGWLTRAHKT